ncbi:MAG: hypothetical protein GXY44_02110, partial [Phycisphaerales bacterium]|nr:hypothetical protein [Phycisphaerales bacterium]
DADWWKQRLIAGPALTDQSYSAANDRYDRRRLLTTLNSDDILRRQRGEQIIRDSGLTDFYNILKPDVNDPMDPLNPYKYGIVGGALAFNGPGLRTQFSLRDVLDAPPPPPEAQIPRGSYRRAMQLTAYYLAMIQGTYKNIAQELLTDPMEQLRTAAQLAVNTIDFADPDPRPSYFAWPDSTTPSVEVVGVKRQPYLTEAYARLVYATIIPDVIKVWDIDSVENESAYAVELYNPYGTPIDLTDFEIWVGPALTDGFPVAPPATVVALSGMSIPAYSYLVISNKDAAYLEIDYVFDDEDTDGIDDYRKIQPLVSTLKIRQGDDVALVRKNIKSLVSIDPPVSFSPPTYVMVDLLRPVILPDRDVPESPTAPVRILKANSDNWVSSAPDQNALNAHTRQPSNEDDRLVWGDSSLQRHKEVPGMPPRYWHFTLARQWLFPLEVEVTDEIETTQKVYYGAPWQFSTAPSGQQLVDDTISRPMQHSLFGTGPNPTAGLSPNQMFVNRDSLGLPLVLAFPNPNAGLTEPVIAEVLSEKLPLAPFPVVCPMPATGRAFPTTGTLLLVTRYAHTPDGPVSVAATLEPHVLNRLQETTLNDTQMRKLDNGHLPIFDPIRLPPYLNEQEASDSNLLEYCLDLEQNEGRSDFPWGQLVFDYFTALPLEELVPLLAEPDYDVAYSNTFPGTQPFVLSRYPVVSPVSSSFGAKVRGRININVAPWWVLDGLPMLAEPAELPVVELHSSLLDPPELTANPTSFNQPANRPAERLMDLLVDDVGQQTSLDPPLGLTSASPIFAKIMVAHREMRRVYDAAGNVEVDLPHGPSDAPGFVSVGNLCSLVHRLGIRTRTYETSTYPQTADIILPLVASRDDPTLPIPLDLRRHTYEETDGDPNTRRRPFGYIGYLQMVAPVVRLQDWVTNRNHAFTIYGSISTTTDPAIHLRMQTIVDRSPCLYGGTATTIASPPIGYYNALED